jgi:hypothetical protein
MMHDIWSQNIISTNRENRSAKKSPDPAIRVRLREGLTQHNAADCLENCTVLVEAPNAIPCNNEQGMGASVENVDKELEEELLVVESDTVIDPGAVVVHPCNAPTASRAVMAVGWLDRIAFLAFLRKDSV